MKRILTLCCALLGMSAMVMAAPKEAEVVGEVVLTQEQAPTNVWDLSAYITDGTETLTITTSEATSTITFTAEGTVSTESTTATLTVSAESNEYSTTIGALLSNELDWKSGSSITWDAEPSFTSLTVSGMEITKVEVGANGEIAVGMVYPSYVSLTTTSTEDPSVLALLQGTVTDGEGNVLSLLDFTIVFDNSGADQSHYGWSDAQFGGSYSSSWLSTDCFVTEDGSAELTATITGEEIIALFEAKQEGFDATNLSSLQVQVNDSPGGIISVSYTYGIPADETDGWQVYVCAYGIDCGGSWQGVYVSEKQADGTIVSSNTVKTLIAAETNPTGIDDLGGVMVKLCGLKGYEGSTIKYSLTADCSSAIAIEEEEIVIGSTGYELDEYDSIVLGQYDKVGGISWGAGDYAFVDENTIIATIEIVSVVYTEPVKPDPEEGFGYWAYLSYCDLSWDFQAWDVAKVWVNGDYTYTITTDGLAENTGGIGYLAVQIKNMWADGYTSDKVTATVDEILDGDTKITVDNDKVCLYDADGAATDYRIELVNPYGYASEAPAVATDTDIAGKSFSITFTIKGFGVQGNAIKDIKADKSDINAVEVARYNLMGQKISGTQKGINIIVYSDGSSKKVLVK